MASTLFQRRILPAIAFQAVVIAGGYATGRELAQFFLSTGPASGLVGIGVTMLAYSLVAMVAFGYAFIQQAHDYKELVQSLLGPAWIVFEAIYIALLMLILAVTSAGAAAVASTLAPGYGDVGLILFALTLVSVVGGGSGRVEGLFRYFFAIRMLVYAIFIYRAFWLYGSQIEDNISASEVSMAGVHGGLTYAGYSIVAVVAVLPTLRHCRSTRDAVIAGSLCGPMAMLPAALFFLAMCAFPQELTAATVPSDLLLTRLNSPWLHHLYQIVMFGGLIESGTGMLHAFNERIRDSRVAHRLIERFGMAKIRIAVAIIALSSAMFVARTIGLVALIADGYGSMSLVVIVVLVLPLLTVGLVRLIKFRGEQPIL